MKKFKIEVDVTATAYVEVEAENEDEAMDMANDEVSQMTVDELKQWETTASIKSVTEQCENCCKNVDEKDTYPITLYRGIKLCSDCVKWAKTEVKDFEFIFQKHIKD